MESFTKPASYEGDRDGTLPLVVGVGGSAGALPALMTLLDALGNARLALIFVPHLAPDHESNAVEILQRVTPLTVMQVTQRVRLQPGYVYVLAPGMDLITEDGDVQPAPAAAKRPSSVIDLFFRSLGKVHGERAIGVVLSGTGRDGSLGLAHVKEYGGLTIAQSPEDSEHGDMPRAAIATGSVDMVMSAAEIGRRLQDFTKYPHNAALAAARDEAAGPHGEESQGDEESEQRAFNDVLAALRVRTRHDFRHYKRGTVMRRLQRRMQVNNVTSIQEYRDFVRRSPEELGPLLGDMLISVTNFFRDPEAFAVLERDVIPQIMEHVTEGDEVRVWIPACASGEESYSIAILLQEYADRMRQAPRIQMFASDINDEALNTARAGIYSANIIADISDSRLLGYFEKSEDSHYRVRAGIRELIVFARHNLLGDPPFSRLDLICCRNLLIYLDRTAQAVALEMFAYALKPGGYLFLGNAESIDSAHSAFQAVDKQHRIYRLRPDAAATARTRIPSQLINIGGGSAPSAPFSAQRGFQPAARTESLAGLHERALLAASPPSVLINLEYDIERVSPGAGRFVTFGEGVPTRGLLSNVAADIRVELRTALFRAAESRQSVSSVFRRSAEPGESNGTVMALSVRPVEGLDGDLVHWLVLFDVPVESSLTPDGQAADDDAYQSALNRMEDENRTLKAHLQETLDRSAVSNEELKASNEELQAINEEMRSAKEELETSKEELQSVNEELTTVNFELRLKVDEAGRNNDDLRNLIEASEIATVFVDPAMRVKRFTPQASKLFSLIPSDVGRPLMDVKNRLRYDDIVNDASAAFNQLRPVERTVSSIDDKFFFARILPYRTSQDKIGGAVLTFVDVTELRLAEARVKGTEERLREAIAASGDFAVLTTDAGGIITTWNEGAVRLFGYASADIVGRSEDLLFTEEDRLAGAPEEERRLAVQAGRVSDERWHQRADGSQFFCSGVTTVLHGGVGLGFLRIARDVSESKNLEIRQRGDLNSERRANAELRSSSDIRDRFLAVMSHELKQPLNLIQVNAELLIRMPEHKDSPTVQRIGDTIKRAVTAQETIVNDMLDLSRMRTGKLRLYRESVEITQLVARLAQTIEPEVARKQITLQVDVAEPMECDCDPVRIEQVVWNLLGNAVKFTPANGRIRVSVSQDGDCALLEVADTGVGLPPEALHTIFELFGQDESGYGVGQRRIGLGIGLAVVRELVEAHGGRVAAASPGQGQGAIFSVWLPLANEAGRRVSAPALSTPFSARRILIVDDDTDSLMALAAILEMEGAVVGTASSGKAALQALGEHQYDVLLSDIGMAEMSGIELIQEVRKLPSANGMRSIAVTGYGRDADIAQALQAGFDAHVSKPVSLERLQAAFVKFGAAASAP